MSIKDRISSGEILHLKQNEIFVFGSNTIGKHGKGAAKQALSFGAKPGIGIGLQGNTYGIPTKGSSMKKILSLNQIKIYVDDFIEFARNNPDLIFLVTEIGCGLSKYDPKDIAPLFEEAVGVENIHLPRRFWRKLGFTNI